MSERSTQSSSEAKSSASATASADLDAWLLRHPRFAIGAWTIVVLLSGVGVAMATDALSRGLRLVTCLGFALLLVRTVRRTRAQQS
jgi:hypothetical protein